MVNLADLTGAARLELQVHMDAELSQHRFSETQLRELETCMGQELRRNYRIPESERQRMKARNY